MLQVLLSQFFNFWLHCGRKHHERARKAFASHHLFLLDSEFFLILAFLKFNRYRGDDLIHRFLEIHLYHLVCLIEDTEEALVEHQEPSLEAVLYSSWGANDYLYASAD